MAEIYDEIGRHDRANHLREKAALLFNKFNEVFWNEELGFYAYTLDGDKRPVFSIASNPGHCLWSGIVREDRAARVVARLMQPDMWSGWGIRTLSALHKSFNPYNYQTGAVWPHDNAMIAFGFRRYGFAAEAAAVARCISGAASHFLINQLPELYAGIQRDSLGFPVQYIGANVPQAWAAGTPFVLLQAMLGIVPDAPHGRLYVDPALPDWMPDVTLIDLRLGRKMMDLRFWRDGEETKFEVLRGDASSVALRPIADGLGLKTLADETLGGRERRSRQR
jgi:glycogen debranching enzyme